MPINPFEKHLVLDTVLGIRVQKQRLKLLINKKETNNYHAM